MTVDRIVHTVAGTFILGSLALAKFHHPNWIWFTVFVGANLLQSGLTNWCLLSTKHERSATLPKAKPEGHRPGRGGVTVDRIVHTVAGTFILGSLALAKFHHPNWIWFTVFVGANLLQSGLTNWCLLSTILRKLGVPEGPGVGCSR